MGYLKLTNGENAKRINVTVTTTDDRNDPTNRIYKRAAWGLGYGKNTKEMDTKTWDPRRQGVHLADLPSSIP
jgi:hypothetical protein